MCVILCYQNPDIIGLEPPKCRDTEEADEAVTADGFFVTDKYNACTTVDYSGLTNNLLSFQLVPTNPDDTPALSRVALLMHMHIY